MGVRLLVRGLGSPRSKAWGSECPISIHGCPIWGGFLSGCEFWSPHEGPLTYVQYGLDRFGSNCLLRFIVIIVMLAVVIVMGVVMVVVVVVVVDNVITIQIPSSS